MYFTLNVDIIWLWLWYFLKVIEICFVISCIKLQYKKELVVVLFILVIIENVAYIYNNYIKLQGKSKWKNIDEYDTALITGGCGDLGCEIVKELIKMGIGKVVILDLNDDLTRFSKSELLKIDFRACDFRTMADVKSITKNILHEYELEGRDINILINCAGMRHSNSFVDIRDDELEDIFNVNTMASIWISKYLLQNHFEINRKSQKESRLCIVFISSVLGYLAPRNLSIYSASKAAIIQIYQALAAELAAYELIRLILVVPGQLTTKMFSDVEPPYQFFAPLVDHRYLAKDIAARIQSGEKGVLKRPLYVNFLPLVNILPYTLQKFCKNVSRMDKVVFNKSKTD